MKDFLFSQGPTHGIVTGGNAGRCSRHKTCEKSVKEKAEFIPQVWVLVLWAKIRDMKKKSEIMVIDAKKLCRGTCQASDKDDTVENKKLFTMI